MVTCGSTRPGHGLVCLERVYKNVLLVSLPALPAPLASPPFPLLFPVCIVDAMSWPVGACGRCSAQSSVLTAERPAKLCSVKYNVHCLLDLSSLARHGEAQPLQQKEQNIWLCFPPPHQICCLETSGVFFVTVFLHY